MKDEFDTWATRAMHRIFIAIALAACFGLGRGIVLALGL